MVDSVAISVPAAILLTEFTVFFPTALPLHSDSSQPDYYPDGLLDSNDTSALLPKR